MQSAIERRQRIVDILNERRCEKRKNYTKYNRFHLRHYVNRQLFDYFLQKQKEKLSTLRSEKD